MTAKFGSTTISANTLRLEQNTSNQPVLELNNAIYSLDDWQFEAPRMRIEQNTLKAYDVHFIYNEFSQGRIKELLIERISTETPDTPDQFQISMSDFSLSFCPNPQKRAIWGFEGKSLTLDSTAKLATSRGGKIRVLSFALPLPVSHFPLDGRSISGWLIPIVTQQQEALDISLPYLLTFSEAADITLTPRLIADTGQGIESNLRYLHRNQSGSLSAATFETDTQRFNAIHWHHQAKWGPWRLHADYSDASEATFLNQYGLKTFSVPKTAGQYLQKISLSYHQEHLNLSLATVNLKEDSDGRLGDYSGEFEFSLRTDRSSQSWQWYLETQLGQYKRYGSNLYFNPLPADRPSGADERLERQSLDTAIHFRPEIKWGWIDLGLGVNRSQQHNNYEQSTLVQIDLGLNLHAATRPTLSLKPRAQLRWIDLQTSENNLSNIDSLPLPASSQSVWSHRQAGQDLVPSRERMSFGAELASNQGNTDIKVALAWSRYGAAPAESLLSRIEPQLENPEQISLVEMALHKRTAESQHIWLLLLSKSDWQFNTASSLSYALDAPWGGLKLAFSERKKGAGLNTALKSVSFDLSFPISDRIGITANQFRDLQYRRNIRQKLGIQYRDNCFEFSLSYTSQLTTDYRSATVDQWQNWHNLPIVDNDRLEFKFHLKTGA
ncbi:MAG: hypothetical protein ACR2PW_07955 [Gammaproteobacteria bacterium]